MKLAAACVVPAALMAPWSILADYDPPTFEELARESTAVVDATVVGFSQEGHANLEIHRHILGKDAPSTLVGIRLRGTLQLHDILNWGSRYVICLHGDQVFEAGGRFHVREVDGEVQYEYRDWRHPGKNYWMEPARFKEVLRVARAARLEVTEDVYDPVNPTNVKLKCFIRNETAKPMVMRKGYHAGTTWLMAGGLTLVGRVPATAGTEKPQSAKAVSDESLPTIEIPPGDEALLFELPLDEILIKDDAAMKEWRWDWPRRPAPPRSPLHKWREAGLHDHLVFQVDVNILGKDSMLAPSLLLGEAKPGEFARSNRVWLKVKQSPEE